MAATVGGSHDLMAAIASYVPSATALRTLLEVLPPALLGGTWVSVLRLLQHPKLDPNALWPTVQFKAIEAVFNPRGKIDVWALPELQPLWAMGVDVAFQYMYDDDIARLRDAQPLLVDVDAFGFQECATVNVAKGVWTGCMLRLSSSSTQDGVAAMARAVATMPSLRHVTLNLSQVSCVLESDPPEFEYFAAPFPAALEPYVWTALSPSHLVDVTILGGDLLATTKGVSSAIQWLASRPLRRLCLSDVRVAAHDVDALVTAMRNCTTLSTIELSYDLTLVSAFLSAPLPRHVRRLRLFVSDEPYHPKSGWFKITALPVPSGRLAHFVATAIDGSALTHLSLDVHRLGNDSVAAIVSTALQKMPRLTHLELLNVPSGPHLGAVLATNATRIQALESLRLQEQPVDSFDMFGASDY
ncbi:hypothetical protein SDRG_16781 [Saprolegnia diclina VS20]|uniref:Uncharacterized protein n=1 Tax=Saprolegnia diclina (strain VS20) TaxID=1156394 RepID=T0R7A2_SAPDV|nr:hypothetical protein SDRG_16781 [Saprolegnia diclina VS20]EQC25372.1 hypothetical protein SDRG_16781 [Saprolegnia diclina VS20]|eukprot:XP_008621222.1 hypothetical protein SDRG_16781 [Saprolegnia diclina VS20]